MRAPTRHVRHLSAALALALLLAACSSDTGLDADDGAREMAGEEMADDDMGDAAGADELLDGATSPAPTVTRDAGVALEPVDPSIRFEPTQPVPDERTDEISPFVDAADDELSTFALDVDTSSWTQAMTWLDEGQRPPVGIVRPEEFVNWFDYGYPQPEEGWAVHVDGVDTTPWNDTTSLLRVGLVTAAIDPVERPDATLTFVVDTSGSMSGGPLETVKQTLTLLVEQLRPSDRIGLVEYGSRARVLLDPTPLSESDEVLAAIDGLQTNGSTNAAEGLQLGYEMAQRSLTPGGIDVVVLASDGVANVGITDADGILATIDEGVGAGIDLLALGMSGGSYNDQLMEQLSNRGNGTTYYLRDVQDAERLFVDELEQTLVVAARDSKVQVQFDPRVVERYRLIGYDNRAVADEDFRDDSVDAGEVGVGHEVTALYEVELAAGARDGDVLAEVRLRWEDPTTRRVDEVGRGVLVDDLQPDASTGFGTAVQAVTLAEVLRDSPYVDVSLSGLAEFDAWGASTEAAEAIRRAADAAPAPGA